MNRLKYVVLTAIAAFALTACEPAANTTASNQTPANANVNTNSNTATAAAPTVDSLMTLERSAFEALGNKDTAFWDKFLAANVVVMGPKGKMEKAAIVTMNSGLDCEVKNRSFSDQQMTQLGPDAGLITYKVSQDGTCDGQKLPANAWVATVYVRERGQWQAAFHANQPIADPNAKPPAATAKPAAPAPTSAPANAEGDELLALEKKAWDAWRAKDANGLEEWAGSKMVAFTDKGREDRAGAIKTWTADDCQVKSVNFTEPSSKSFAPDIALLTFRAAVDGKCSGNAVPPLQGGTIYTKEGGAWKAAFTVNLPLQ